MNEENKEKCKGCTVLLKIHEKKVCDLCYYSEMNERTLVSRTQVLPRKPPYGRIHNY